MPIKIKKVDSINNENIYNFLKVNRQKYNKKYNKEKIFRNNIINIIYIIIITFSLILSINNNTDDIFGNITLKIKGPGLQEILSSSFDSNYYPNIIFINGIQNLTRDYKYDLPLEINTIKLVWNDNNIYSYSQMFKDCS